ncbi:MAG: hypothetical protein AMXMBFR58_18210 [Phycisphaerae bacterium]
MQLAREALRLPPTERDGYLAAQCGGDLSLLSLARCATDAMLSATVTPHMTQAEPGEIAEADPHASATIFGVASTNAGDFQSQGTGATHAPAGGTHPARLGAYRILGVLGEGGMGVVYLAEQDRPRRTVALKVVRAGMMSPAMLRRFEHESQVLGRLQHPGIAQVFEAGVALGDDGRPTPFFAMEYVRGRSLAEHVREGGLEIATRLELIASVCDAVQHAHSHGVIHLDLKPGNILVTAEGHVKVLDFGIARATDADVRATMQTDAGQLVGTIAYMSPEQIAADPATLDTRSDIFSLGVVLYELLTGSLPLDVVGKSIVEAARLIATVDPPPASRVMPALRGDLSTIIAKAMEKDRDRRYQTASELAADIRRYLRDEPITARPPTAAYQFRKFAARNRGLVTAAGAAVALLCLGVVGTSMGMARAIAQQELTQQQKTRADDEARTAEALNEFLVNRMLAAATPEEAQGRQVTVSEVVDKAAGEIDGAFADRPLVKAKLYDAVGKTYTSLGEYEKAEKFMVGAVGIRREYGHGSAAETGAALYQLGSLRFRQTRWEDARALFEESAGVFAATGKNDKELIEARSSIAACLRNLGKLEEAEQQQRLAIEEAGRRLGPEHQTTLTAMTNLAIVLHDSGRIKEAREFYQTVADTRRRVLGENHPGTLLAVGNLATALYDLGDVEGAERAMTEVMEARRRVSGADHPDTISDMSNVAVMREKLGRVTEAETLYREALEIARRRLGDSHETTAITLSNLASNLGRQERHEEAEQCFRQSIEILTSSNGPGHAETLQTRLSYGRWLFGRDRLEDARRELGEVNSASAKAFGADFPITVGSAATLALILEKLGDTQAALAMAQKALDGRTKLLGADHPAVAEMRDVVTRLIGK